MHEWFSTLTCTRYAKGLQKGHHGAICWCQHDSIDLSIFCCYLNASGMPRNAWRRRNMATFQSAPHLALCNVRSCYRTGTPVPTFYCRVWPHSFFALFLFLQQQQHLLISLRDFAFLMHEAEGSPRAVLAWAVVWTPFEAWMSFYSGFVLACATAWSPSKGPYRLCIGLGKLKEEVKAQWRSVEL
jgi:hypothetical protein